ncbi:MAG: putative MFS family arabinose efflux permease [Porticoccaceae bacterium]|jgi:predicted MFS family arabinose efflux permease
MNTQQTFLTTESVSPAVLVLALAMAPAVGLGIARFAYALVLPDMRTDLGWSWTAAGWMNTSNALGYLVGALLSARAIDKWGSGATMLSGALACVISLVLCAVLTDSVLLNMARVLAGLGGGLAFVAGGVLAASVSARDPDRSSFLLGLFYAGPGLGIAISGLVVPVTLYLIGPGSWSMAWALLAVISIPLVGALMFGLRAEGGPRPRSQVKVSLGNVRLLLTGYCLFGVGYIAYMTFMIAWVRDGGGSVVDQSLFWALIGVAAMISPWLWARVHRCLKHGHAFALLCSLTAIGGVVPLIHNGPIALYVSGAIFGCTFFAVVASTTVFVRRNYAEAAWGRAIGVLTVSFGIGQVLGPVVIGVVNDATGGLSSGLIASTGLLVLGALMGGLQRDIERIPKSRLRAK